MGEKFARKRVMHELKCRHLRVRSSVEIAPRMQRITLAGEDLAGFVAPGPDDHLKLFFPDSPRGEIVFPRLSEGRLIRPSSGVPIARDYTPLEFRPDSAGGELDIDFVLHGDDKHGDDKHGDDKHGDDKHGGPAASWAQNARPGDALVALGPRGSLLAPRNIESAILVADESALPAAARWLQALDAVPVRGLFTVADVATAAYFSEEASAGRSLQWFSGNDRDAQLAAALKLAQIDPGTFVFLAGEAGALIPLRRYLRRELGLPAAQVSAHGYWKRGEANLDHHAPLDPSDPED